MSPLHRRKNGLSARASEGGNTALIYSVQYPGLAQPLWFSDISPASGFWHHVCSGGLTREGSISLNKIDTAPVAAAASTTPSPVPESPARGAAALAAELAAAAPKGPSPLANVTTAETASEQSPTPQPTTSADEQPAHTVPAVVVNEAESPKPSPRASAPPSSPRSAPGSVARSVAPSVSRCATPSAPDLKATLTLMFGWITACGGTTSSDGSSGVAPERAVTDKPSTSYMRQRGSFQVIIIRPQSRIASRKPSEVLQARYTELAGTTNTWSNSSEMGLGSKTSLAMHDSSFADPKVAAVPEPANTVVSPAEIIHVAESVSAIDFRSPCEDSMFPAGEPQAVPLPAMYEVMATRPLVARGWVEFFLSHGPRYYENRESHAITDIDLRNLARLDEVSVTIETAEVVPEGCEMGIRGVHGGKKGSRRVLNEVPSEENVPSGDDDRLDDEYRYWSFVEIHPAHISRDVVEAARQEAIDALHSSYTDRLLTQ
ncbi:hypothetical protein PAXINDRAFT_13916 [Paxillus involutus ATCC 200175]|uniref:Uncharacterized protein n=1 Tax=Paxillus involutus ATCC 200175 TaxID=664439 RepID=A0A0C9TCN5_PAXIN|nr:hypothetical protein PAXINDRAFT_13916 [Paxillus involutus ATCC 200175]